MFVFYTASESRTRAQSSGTDVVQRGHLLLHLQCHTGSRRSRNVVYVPAVLSSLLARVWSHSALACEPANYSLCSWVTIQSILCLPYFSALLYARERCKLETGVIEQRGDEVPTARLEAGVLAPKNIQRSTHAEMPESWKWGNRVSLKIAAHLESLSHPKDFSHPDRIRDSPSDTQVIIQGGYTFGALVFPRPEILEGQKNFCDAVPAL